MSQPAPTPLAVPRPAPTPLAVPRPAPTPLTVPRPAPTPLVVPRSGRRSAAHPSSGPADRRGKQPSDRRPDRTVAIHRAIRPPPIIQSIRQPRLPLQIAIEGKTSGEPIRRTCFSAPVSQIFSFFLFHRQSASSGSFVVVSLRPMLLSRATSLWSMQLCYIQTQIDSIHR